jgi:hypothetical protein
VRLQDASVVRVDERILEHGRGQAEQNERGEKNPSREHVEASLTVAEDA